MHLNWWRHYDPTTGRYTQTDPLGFGAGKSLYGYARGRPTSFTDADGRCGPLCLMLAKAAIGGTVAAAFDFGYQVGSKGIQCVSLGELGKSFLLGLSVGAFGAAAEDAVAVGDLTFSEAGVATVNFSAMTSGLVAFMGGEEPFPAMVEGAVGAAASTGGAHLLPEAAEPFADPIGELAGKAAGDQFQGDEGGDSGDCHCK